MSAVSDMMASAYSVEAALSTSKVATVCQVPAGLIGMFKGACQSSIQSFLRASRRHLRSSMSDSKGSPRRNVPAIQ